MYRPRLSQTILCLSTLLLAGLLLGACCCRVQTCCTTRPATQRQASPKYLFVQAGEHAELRGGRLVLSGVSRTTVFFSDRPERITGHVTTGAFIDGWTTGPNSFADTPPNATLSSLGGKTVSELVLTLSDPVYDPQAGTLSYAADVLAGKLATDGSGVSLFIDDAVAFSRHPIEHGTIENRYPGGSQRKILHGTYHHTSD